jgi:hypothetical protein
VRWITTNKNFVVSRTGRTTIAGHLAAQTRRGATPPAPAPVSTTSTSWADPAPTPLI